MTIGSLKELDKLLALCRKRGVQSIRVDNIEFHLGEMPNKSTKQQLIRSIIAPDVFIPGGVGPDTHIETDELTDEQKLFYSAVGQ